MGRNFIINAKDTVWWCSGKSVQIEDTGVCATEDRIGTVWHGNSPKNIDAWLSEVEIDGEKKYRSEISTAKFWRQNEKIETGAVVTGRSGLRGIERGKVICYWWKEKVSVWRETNVVSGMRVTIVRNRHRKPNHPLSHNLENTKWKCVEKEMPEAEATLRNSIDGGVNTSGTVLAPKSPCKKWHPPKL